MLGVRNMIIRCELCGKEFEASPNRRGNYPRFCPDTHYDNCPICGKYVKGFDYCPYCGIKLKK